MTSPQSHISENQEINSIYGPLVPIWVRTDSPFTNTEELGKAMLARTYDLTVKETDYVALIGRGLTDKELEIEIGKDVHNLNQKIYKILKVNNRTEVANIARSFGLG